MEKLIDYSNKRIASTGIEFLRYIHRIVDWKNRLIAITGARGVGKTTFLLQYIKINLFNRLDEVIYVNADDLYFAKSTLVDFTDAFVKSGGRYLFIDEIHKYNGWSTEIKNIYDYFSELQIIITGSSALDIYKSEADLSRRAISYKMNGLSFREFISMTTGINLETYSLEDIVNNHVRINTQIVNKFKPLKLFEQYVRFGYYPFFIEGEDSYPIKVKQAVNQILETDLPATVNIDYLSIHKLRKLIAIISELVPFKPNVLKLSQQVGVGRETLLKYLYHLEKADLLMLLQSSTHGISQMNKPEKIYLHNPNLLCVLSNQSANKGTLQEVFFLNQLQQFYKVNAAEIGDFFIQNRIFEIGGKNKQKKQIKDISNAFIVADNIEIGSGNKIPLWLFGFLY